MSKWLGIVCVVACFGIGCGDDDVTLDSGPVVMADGGTDSGPVITDTGLTVDTGPVGDDAGTPPGDTGPAPMCDFDGTYGVTPDVANPALCAAVSITECTLVTVDGTTTATCGDVSGECIYNDACVCIGNTEAMGIMIEILADFPNSTLTANAAGQTCVFALEAAE